MATTGANRKPIAPIVLDIRFYQLSLTLQLNFNLPLVLQF